MSNLFKAFAYSQMDVEKPMVIDSNDFSEELIEKRTEKKTYADHAGVADTDGFTCGIQAEEVDGAMAENEENNVISAKYCEMMEQAQKEAEEIIAQARTEASALLEEARCEGYTTGYNEGMQKAEQEFEEKNAKLLSEAENERENLRTEYEELKRNLEPETVSTIADVFCKVFGKVAIENKEMIITLVNSVLRNTELSKNFLIKVGEEDYRFLLDNKNMIFGMDLEDFRIEFMVDNTLSRNMCIIESDAGVFDCSLDIQLENLNRELKLLSSVGI